MKTPAVLLAAAIAVVPFQVHPQERPPADPKFTSFLEGLCVGLVIGLTADALIVVGVNCYRHASTNSPPPVVRPPEPPPATNAPPSTNAISAVLRSGDTGASWYTNGSFAAVLETQADAEPWQLLYQLQGWPADGGQWLILARDAAGVPVLTNLAPALQFLPLQMPTNGTRRLFRLRQP